MTGQFLESRDLIGENTKKCMFSHHKENSKKENGNRRDNLDFAIIPIIERNQQRIEK